MLPTLILHVICFNVARIKFKIHIALHLWDTVASDGTNHVVLRPHMAYHTPKREINYRYLIHFLIKISINCSNSCLPGIPVFILPTLAHHQNSYTYHLKMQIGLWKAHVLWCFLFQIP